VVGVSGPAQADDHRHHELQDMVPDGKPVEWSFTEKHEGERIRMTAVWLELTIAILLVVSTFKYR
jgi:hypothetical protein